jgi:hypothetical protein
MNMPRTADPAVAARRLKKAEAALTTLKKRAAAFNKITSAKAGRFVKRIKALEGRVAKLGAKLAAAKSGAPAKSAKVKKPARKTAKVKKAAQAAE